MSFVRTAEPPMAFFVRSHAKVDRHTHARTSAAPTRRPDRRDFLPCSAYWGGGRVGQTARLLDGRESLGERAECGRYWTVAKDAVHPSIHRSLVVGRPSCPLIIPRPPIKRRCRKAGESSLSVRPSVRSPFRIRYAKVSATDRPTACLERR